MSRQPDLDRLEGASGWLVPFETRYRIAFHDPAEPASPVKVIVPAPRFMAALMAGGIVRRLRVIGQADGRPVYDGSGEIMAPLSEMAAIEFIRWKDMPRQANRWAIVTADDIPQDRAFRNAWEIAA